MSDTPRMKLIKSAGEAAAKRYGTAFFNDHILYMLPDFAEKHEDPEVRSYFQGVYERWQGEDRAAMNKLVKAVNQMAEDCARRDAWTEKRRLETQVYKAEKLIELIEGALLDRDWQRIEQGVAEFRG